MFKEVIASDKAPRALGPYSAGIVFGNLLFASGQTPIDPITNAIVDGGIEAQTRQCLTNIKNVLEAAGSSLPQVLKTTVFLKDMNDFAKMNEIYGEFFKENPPARSTVQVARLPKDAMVEIEAIAAVE